MKLSRALGLVVALLVLIGGTELSAQLIKPFKEQSPTAFTTNTPTDVGRGNKFKVNIEGQAVYQLGAYYPTSGTTAFTVVLWDFAAQKKLGEVKTTPGPGWLWADLPNPVPLEKGKEYVVIGYGNGYYYTSAAPASWVFKGDLEYEGMQYCSACATTKAFPTSFLGSNYIYGVVDIAYGPQASEWLGAASTDWNDPNNWSQGVPSVDLGAKIPDAGTTPNDPHMPAAPTVLKTFEIASGGVVYGGNAQVRLLGDWTNKGGTFIPENSLIMYDGDKPQKIESFGRTIGNVQIMNKVGEITVVDEFTALNAGTFSTDPGTNVYFEWDTLSFASSSIDNQGTFHFGLDGGGIVATLQSITTSGQVLGNAEIVVKDAMDAVEFLGPVAFSNLTLSGAGTVTFSSTLDVTGTFINALSGNLVIGDLATSGDLNFSGDADVVISGDVSGRNLNHTGQGSLTISGSLTLTGNANFSSMGAGAVATLGTFAPPTLKNVQIDGTLIVNPLNTVTPAVIFAGITVVGSDATFLAGNTVFDAATTLANTQVSTNGTVSFNSTTSTKDLRVNGLGTMKATQDFTVNGNLTLTGSASIDAAATLIVHSNVSHDSLGTFKVADRLTLEGNGSSQVSAGGSGITCRRMRIGNAATTSEVILSGKITCTGVGGVNATSDVLASAGLTLADGFVWTAGSPGGSHRINIDGALSTSSGASALAPKITASATNGNEFYVYVRAGARVNVNGLILENVGPPTSPYGVEIRASSQVVGFNNVMILGCDASVATMQLATNSLPTIISGFSCAGTAPSNIDATNVSGVRIEVKEAKPTSGNLYGAPFEIDPNGVLYWENPPVVDVISNAILPNALAENPYTFTLDAVGGNQPLSWALANQPSFLTINPTTGELTGTPGREHIGTHVFVVLTYDDSHPSLTANKVLTLVVDSLTNVGVTIVTPTTLINGKVGQSYRYALAAAGGSGGGFTWHLINPNALPKGLFLNSETGEIYGTPSPEAAGVYNVAMRVEDAQGNSSVKSFEITVHTEFSDPALIAASLSDGPGGGCAVQNGVNWLLLASIVVLLSALAIRRREQA